MLCIRLLHANPKCSNVSCYFLNHFSLDFSSMVMWQAINIIGWSHNIMKFKDVMTVHQMTSSPKLLLCTCDSFLISALFEVLETQWTLLLNFLFFIVLLHSTDIILIPKILYNQLFWSLKSYLCLHQLICNNIILFVSFSIYEDMCQKHLKYL